MNRERTRDGKPASAIHKLVVAEPERARPSGRALLLLSLALISGVAVGLLWLQQNPRGTLEMLPEAVAQATASAAALTVEAEADATSTEVAAVADVATSASLNTVASNGGAVSNLAMARAAQQATLAPPTPTPTSTPRPPLDKVEAVVAIGGVTLWDGTSGLLMGQAPQGALFTATARSSDGEWLYGTLEDGSNGWARIDQLIVFDAQRLRAEDVVIMPITPTPAMADAPAGAGQAQMSDAAGGESADDSGDEMVLRPTPVPGDAAVGRVNLAEGRLNLRAGPGSDYAIIAKGMPGEHFNVVGRNAARQWLQLIVPDVTGGIAWAAAEYITLDGRVDDLPVSSDTSNAPLYQDGDNTTKGGQAKPTPQQPESQGYKAPADAPVVHAPQAATSSVTGLSGKLAIQTTWGGDIYIYDLVTGELRLLTGGFDPAISPDGRTVAFTRIGGEHGLYLIDIDGTNERKIFSERARFLAPKWSPDGQYIVFERGDELLNCTRTPLDDPDPAGACLVDREPENSEEIQEKLARVDVNGENYQDIPVLPRAHAPDWNSAGIVYHSPAGIQKTKDNPSAQTELVFFNIRKQYELDPDWQPNGGRIIFQRRENDHWEIYSVAPDGSNLTALTFPTFTLVEKLPSNVAPAWSPDGQHIVYLSNRQPNQSAGEWRVWVMDANGSNQRPLDIDLSFTYTFVAEQMLDWGR